MCGFPRFLANLVVFFGLWTAVASLATADFVGHGAPIRDVVIAADGSLALTGGFDDQLIVWDVAERRLRHRLLGHEAAVNAVAFVGPANEQALSGSDDGTVRLWDLRTGEELKQLLGHEKKVVAVATSSDGRRAASASWDRTVRLWDLESGAELAVFRGHESSVNAVAFLPDGQALVSAGYDGQLWRWPVGEGAPARLASFGFPIADLAVSADGGRVLTGSADGEVRLFDLESREILKSFQNHEGAVLAVAASPDGRFFASGGTDGHLALWQVDRAGAPLIIEIEHYNAVWSIAFSPDSQIVYAGGVDPIARAWFTASGQSVIGATTDFQQIERVSLAAASSKDPIERGAYHFRKCAVCHNLDNSDLPKAGPNLIGLFGRRVGSHPGYRYSDALRTSTLVWNEQTVSQLFELGPDVLLPGTKMPLQKLPDAQARTDLIAFLKEKTARP